MSLIKLLKSASSSKNRELSWKLLLVKGNRRNTKVEIKLIAHDAFLEPSSGTLNIEILENQIIQSIWEQSDQRA